MVPSVCTHHSRRSEFLHPRPQLNLPRPGAAGLMDEVYVGAGDGVGIKQAVRIVGRIRPARAFYAAVDDDMRDMNALGRKLARHALRKSTQREFPHGERWRLWIAR